jgi:hypothetical protein
MGFQISIGYPPYGGDIQKSKASCIVRPNPPPLSVGGPGDGLGITCLLSTGIGCGWSLG